MQFSSYKLSQYFINFNFIYVQTEIYNFVIIFKEKPRITYFKGLSMFRSIYTFIYSPNVLHLHLKRKFYRLIWTGSNRNEFLKKIPHHITSDRAKLPLRLRLIIKTKSNEYVLMPPLMLHEFRMCVRIRVKSYVPIMHPDRILPGASEKVQFFLLDMRRMKQLAKF